MVKSNINEIIAKYKLTKDEVLFNDIFYHIKSFIGSIQIKGTVISQYDRNNIMSDIIYKIYTKIDKINIDKFSFDAIIQNMFKQQLKKEYARRKRHIYTDMMLSDKSIEIYNKLN